jgi:hypothetical protein
VRNLVRDSWREELDSFSRRHEGWLVSITTQSPQGDITVAAHDVPLQGVSPVYPHGNEIAIAVGSGGGEKTHEVRDPSALEIDVAPNEADRALIIHGGDGTTTTIEFRSPMRAEEVDGLPTQGRQ